MIAETLYLFPDDVGKLIESLRKQMKKAADALEFEEAARIRDRIKGLRMLDLSLR